jgi:hypothetical protein
MNETNELLSVSKDENSKGCLPSVWVEMDTLFGIMDGAHWASTRQYG